MGHDTREGMSRHEVAEILGVTPERIRQIEYKALQKLRNRAIRKTHRAVNILRIHYEDLEKDR
jgi:DNA-directed RNA polymerase sigma subunit (sigma70/sigma32)